MTLVDDILNIVDNNGGHRTNICEPLCDQMNEKSLHSLLIFFYFSFYFKLLFSSNRHSYQRAVQGSYEIKLGVLRTHDIVYFPGVLTGRVRHLPHF